MIDIEKHPALKQILWDYNGHTISEKDAFWYYEERLAKWFDEDEIAAHEMMLINYLVDTYGNGISIL